MTEDDARGLIRDALFKAHEVLTIEDLREECEYQIDGIQELIDEDED